MVFAKAREFRFSNFFQLGSSFVILISVVGYSTFAFAATPTIEILSMWNKNTTIPSQFFQKLIFPSSGKDFPSTPLPLRISDFGKDILANLNYAVFFRHHRHCVFSRSDLATDQLHALKSLLCIPAVCKWRIHSSNIKTSIVHKIH